MIKALPGGSARWPLAVIYVYFGFREIPVGGANELPGSDGRIESREFHQPRNGERAAFSEKTRSGWSHRLAVDEGFSLRELLQRRIRRTRESLGGSLRRWQWREKSEQARSEERKDYARLFGMGSLNVAYRFGDQALVRQ